MFITLDRRFCTRCQASCESCFTTRLLQENFDAADCCLDTTQGSSATLDFSITDRDGSHKELSVTPANRAEAMDSWLLLWQQQAGRFS